jgi:hypothetical protein
MNKLKTSFSAGVDFNWDDLDWMQAAVRDALYGFLGAFGIDPEDSFILSGCEVTLGPDSASTTAGYLALNGEICKVEAHSITYDGESDVIWVLGETDDPSGTETDSNGNTVQCYQKRVARLQVASSYDGAMPYYAPTLIQVIATELGLDTSWTSIPFNATYFGGTSLVMNGSGTKIYYKVVGNTMTINFTLSVTSMDASTLTFNLAAATGYKILKTMNAAGILSMTDNNGPVLIKAIENLPYSSLVHFTKYGNSLDNLASATISGQIILEVQHV